MSWSRRRTLGCLIAAVPAGLAGCGLRPLYGKREGNAGTREALADTSIQVVRASEPKHDRLGQMLHNELLDRINPAGRLQEPRYSLRVNLAVSREETGIQITEQATRARLYVSVGFWLTDKRTGKTLMYGSDRSVSSFNILDSQYAALSAERDAQKRAVREIADSLQARLAIYFDRQKS